MLFAMHNFQLKHNVIRQTMAGGKGNKLLTMRVEEHLKKNFKVNASVSISLRLLIMQNPNTPVCVRAITEALQQSYP